MGGVVKPPLYGIPCIKEDRHRPASMPCMCADCVAARDAARAMLDYKAREIDALYEAVGESMARLAWGNGDPGMLDADKAHRWWMAKPWHYRARVRVAGWLRPIRERVALRIAPWLEVED